MSQIQRKSEKSRQFITPVSIAVLILCCLSMLFNKCQPPEGPEGMVSAMGSVIQMTCREYLLQGEQEDMAYALYSYVLIKKEPQDSLERNRCLMLWRAYRFSFRKYQECASHEAFKLLKENVNIAYWPLRVDSGTEISNERKEENGIFFINNYDYARANVILSRIPDMKTPGPFIVTYHYPLGNMMPQIPDKKEILIMDLSRIDEKLFADILDLFQRKVKDDPGTWKNKFDWELIRVHFCSALTTHGEQILYAAQWMGNFFGGFKEAFPAP